MGEAGCLNDGQFQNLQVEGNTIFTSGLTGFGGGGTILSGGIGTIPDGATTTITADLMLDNSVLNYASGTNVTDALFATGAQIETALINRGIVPANGMSFDVYINNSDATAFTFADINEIAGIASGNDSSEDNTVIPVAASGLSPCAHFRFIRTGADAYTVFNLRMAAS